MAGHPEPIKKAEPTYQNEYNGYGMPSKKSDSLVREMGFKTVAASAGVFGTAAFSGVGLLNCLFLMLAAAVVVSLQTILVWDPDYKRALRGPQKRPQELAEVPEFEDGVECDHCHKVWPDFTLTEVVRYKGGELPVETWCHDCVDEQLESIKQYFLQGKTTLEQLEANLDLFLGGTASKTYVELKDETKREAFEERLGLRKTYESLRQEHKKRTLGELILDKYETEPISAKAQNYAGTTGRSVEVREYRYPKDARSVGELVEVKKERPTGGGDIPPPVMIVPDSGRAYYLNSEQVEAEAFKRAYERETRDLTPMQYYHFLAAKAEEGSRYAAKKAQELIDRGYVKVADPLDHLCLTCGKTGHEGCPGVHVVLSGDEARELHRQNTSLLQLRNVSRGF